AVDPQNAPHTFGPAGVVPSPKAARGVIVYIGLDESKAAADGTNLSAIAGELQAYAKELASQAETQAVIALAPQGRRSDIDAVRADRQAYAKERAGQAETRAVIALPPVGRAGDIAAVRAVATGSPAATGAPAATHGPVRSRIPNRIHPPTLREDSAPAPVSPRGFGGRAGDVYTDAAGERLRIDIPRREVRIDGELVDVTTKDFELLATLVTH